MAIFKRDCDNTKLDHWKFMMSLYAILLTGDNNAILSPDYNVSGYYYSACPLQWRNASNGRRIAGGALWEAKRRDLIDSSWDSLNFM